MRLQKYIAHCGVASRRKAEEMIQQGRVKVNGQVVQEMGVMIDPNYDEVRVDEKLIQLEENKVYILLNKPIGYITSLSDEKNRPTVADLVDDINERIYPVGRLDYNTSGLLLMTNDGNLSYQLTHPKHEVKKTYIAKIEGFLTLEELKQFEEGIDIGGYITAKASIKVLVKGKKSTKVQVIIHEGKNRQIRRMFEQIGHKVIQLKRIKIGDIELGKLSEGQWRHLKSSEVKYLKSC